jgi:two-component system, response regulator, stage 0 sporulation protein F
MSGAGSAFIRQEGTRMQKKVLIVDDDPLVALGLEKVVSKEGFETATASTGAKALQKIEEDPPDVVLLDIKLPDSLDGLALLEIIK